jgi:hypothetical protein
MCSVEQVFGPETLERAAELWLEQLDVLDLSLKDFE